MLTNVPTAYRVAIRAKVMRHPNSMPCEVWRKRVTRTMGAEDGSMGGLPTLGGIGILDPEDEAEVDYDLLGEGRVLFAATYEPSTLSDRRDTAQQGMAEASIEPDTEGAWEPKDSDLVMCLPGGGAVLTYEVTRVINTVNIPPYVAKVELQAQGELMFVPWVAANQAGRT